MGNSTTAVTVGDPNTIVRGLPGSLLLIEDLKNFRRKFNILIIFNDLLTSVPVQFLFQVAFLQWPQKSQSRIRIRIFIQDEGSADPDPDPDP
jgi:hypothetical protein